jgi:5-methylcytosine-specific restriction endonuclease McrA
MYFQADTLIRLGSVWVCSKECQQEKLSATQSRAVKRDSDRKGQIDKGPIREAVGRRDGFYCLLCGQKPPLHLHRVKYASEGGEYAVDNTVFLCDDHHLNTVHASKRVWQPLLLAHLRGEREARVAIFRQLRADSQV